MGRVIVLNGASSSGKTSLGRALQDVLDGDWHLLGIDTFFATCPVQWYLDGTIVMADGVVTTSDTFRAAYRRWCDGVGHMVRAGLDVVIDEVLLDGDRGQRVWTDALAPATPVWVKVWCPSDVGATRELARGDRMLGLAAEQAERVHARVRYDLVVDTSAGPPDELASHLAAHLHWSE